ncbi:MAG: DUF1292 domain-containing protein [Clostridia bacterium]|nr:DUF1292 domain-containing protein [Clostridia bacterium]
MQDENIVQFSDEQGKVYNFYHIGTIDHAEKTYAFFQAAEEVEGVNPDEVIIYELTDDNDLLPVEDQAVLDAVFNAFMEEMEDGCDCEECGHEHHHHHCDCGCEDEE